MTSCDSNLSHSSAPQMISVAIPRPLHGLFTYKLPAHLVPLVKVGGWVKVRFGNAATHAFIVEPPRPLSELPAGLSVNQLKEVLEVGDPDAVFPADVLSLCRWAHEYYCVPLGEVLNGAGSHSSLAKKKLKRGPRPIVRSSPSINPSTHVLTSEQQGAVEFLEKARQEKLGKVVLLKGVTGSGKTEIYIELAKKTLEEGKGVLILVPEIALTPQLHRRFEDGLGIPVGLWHSAISNGQRRDLLAALQSGEVKVVVGARSAVFAPVQQLGLLVVDEEHDPTYKQEDRVRYHARDLAVVRAKITNSLTILGSATPSLETQERVREKRYLMTTLDHRIASGGLPQIEIVDLRIEDKVANTQALLARRTVQKIQETIDAGGQVIVYLNRRGFASFLLCSDCGEVKGCPHCSVSLALHKKKLQLRCHLCTHHEGIPDLCHKCQSPKLRAMGAGTESLETELPKLVSGAKILRLDRDQITSATRLGVILDEFRRGEANLLLGTQMLVKGHDFPGVTLVVVVMADSLFRWPDFRAPERAVQILKQVAGRAGRGEKPGKVMIQTFNVDHPVLQVIQGQILEEDFLEGERQLRQILGYPPFGRLVRFRFENSSKEEAFNRAQEIATQLRKIFDQNISPVLQSDRTLELLGPSEAFLEKIKGIYRWDLLLKAKNIQILQRAVSFSKSVCAQRKWQFIADIDPYGI